MADIQIFNNPRFGEVRIANNGEEPLFCAMDLCRALGYANGRKAVADHCDEWDVTKRDTPTKNQWDVEVMQRMTYVNESGMYALVLGSKLQSAKEFKRWLTKDVLPTIRKHGIYATEATIDSIIADPDNGIKLLTALKEERQQRKLAEDKVALLEEVTRVQAPKVVFADAVTGSQTNILIRDLAKLIQQNGYNIGEKRLYQWLRDNGYLCTYGQNYNKPMQRYVEQGLFFIKEGAHTENGVMTSNFTTMVTGKGQQYFINKFINQ